MTIRNPAVAGLFYPGTSDELRSNILSMLAANPISAPVPKAIIAPHAGYIYSGPVAATVYNSLKPAAEKITRVILLGPSHRVAFSGLATSSAIEFSTPLGLIPIDTALVQKLLAFSQVQMLDKAHAQEHSLEVQLPFLQMVLNKFTLVPLVVGDCSPEDVADVLDFVWGGEETLIVVSSDLSHYLDYNSAKRIDRQTSDAILHLQPEKIAYENACGRNPVNGLLTVAKRKNLSADIIDIRNSGDTAGPKDRVVGYGAYVFYSP